MKDDDNVSGYNTEIKLTLNSQREFEQTVHRRKVEDPSEINCFLNTSVLIVSHLLTKALIAENKSLASSCNQTEPIRGHHKTYVGSRDQYLKVA